MASSVPVGGSSTGIIDKIAAQADLQISKAEIAANSFITLADNYLGMAGGVRGSVDGSALNQVRSLIERLATSLPDLPVINIPAEPNTDISGVVNPPVIQTLDASSVTDKVNDLTSRIENQVVNLQAGPGFTAPVPSNFEGFDFSIDDSGLFGQSPPPDQTYDFQERPALVGEVPAITVSIAEVPSMDIPGTAPVLSVNPPSGKPDIQTINLPNIPEFQPPTAPELLAAAIDLPESPDINIPEFITQIVFDIPDPFELSDQQDFWEVANQATSFLNGLTTDFIDSLAPGARSALGMAQTKLMAILNDQQTAIRDDIEARIFERARVRAEKERSRVDQEILTGAAKRGFTLPSVHIAAALTQSQQATADNISNAALETAIKRAELEREYWQFAVTATENAWSVAVQAASQYISNVSQLAVAAGQYSATIARLGMEAYNTALELFKAQLQQWTVEATIYETVVKAELFKIEGFKAQIEAEKLKQEADKNAIAIYKEQIEAESKKLEAAMVRAKLVEAQVQIEQAKLQLFRAEVESYTAQVNGYEAEVRGYSATVDARKTIIDAEAVRAQVDRTQVEAQIAAAKYQIEAKQIEAEVYKAIMQGESIKVDTYGKSIDAYKAQIQADAEILKARIAQQQGTIAKIEAETKMKMIDVDVYRARMEGYKVSLDARKSVVDALESALRGQEAAYKVIASQNENALGVAKLTVEAEKAAVDAEIAAVKGKVDVYGTSMQAATSVANVVAQAAPALANAAANDMEAQIKRIVAGLQETVGVLGVLERAYSGVTQGSYQTAASAISGMNGIAMNITQEALS